MKAASWILGAAVMAGGVAGGGAEIEVASLSTVLSDVARNVGGDKVRVVELVKAGTDPHDFEPSTRDIRRMAAARMVLASGLGMEAYLPKLTESLGGGPAIVVVGESIKPMLIEESGAVDEHGHEHAAAGSGAGGRIVDPHWFHSIGNVAVATNVIRDALIAADPANRPAYEANAAAYRKRLAALEKWARIEVAKLAREKRILVTSHDALGYFARDFGFEIRPVQGISTKDQPSSRTVRELIDTIRRDRVKAIFAENIENPKVIEEITRETGAKLGGTLYADGLGNHEASTYEAMIRHNVGAIVAGLQ